MFLQFDYLKEHDPWFRIKNGRSNNFVVSSNEEPSLDEKIIKNWADNISKRFPSLEICVANGVLRLHKLDNAPEELLNFNKEL